MSQNSGLSNWALAGIGCMILGAILGLLAGSMPLASVFVVIGTCLIFFGSSTPSYRPISYHHEQNDRHYHQHLHQHNYPVQRVSEGHEFSREYPDGRTETVRYLKRSE